MPVKIEKTSKVTIGFDKQRTQEENTHVTARCDGPKCNKPDSACIGVLEWDDSKPEDMPDATARIVTFADFYGSMWSFFSKRCLADFLLNFEPPLSPREKAKMEENNKMIDVSQKVIPMPSVAVEAVGETSSK